MKLDAKEIKALADVLHQARFPKHKYGTVRCGGPKLCCGQDYEMARAVLRRFHLTKRFHL